QVALHPLAFARLLTFQQSDQDAHCAEDAGSEVSDRNADTHRSLARQAGDRHQAAHALRDLIEARTLAVRAGLAEAGYAGMHDPGIDRPQRGIVDAETELPVRTVVLDHHVGIAHQTLQDGDTFWRLQIERDAALVAMQVLEVRPMPLTTHAGVAFGRFDL